MSFYRAKNINGVRMAYDIPCCNLNKLKRIYVP